MTTTARRAAPAPRVRPRSTGHPGYAVSLPYQPRSAGTARQAARITVQCWGLPDALADDAALVASELVTNAVQHVGDRAVGDLSRCRLTVERPSPDTIRVEVSDRSPEHPHQRSAGDADESGRGLTIVAALSESWGVTDRDEGKRVWAVLRVIT